MIAYITHHEGIIYGAGDSPEEAKADAVRTIGYAADTEAPEGMVTLLARLPKCRSYKHIYGDSIWEPLNLTNLNATSL